MRVLPGVLLSSSACVTTTNRSANPEFDQDRGNSSRQTVLSDKEDAAVDRLCIRDLLTHEDDMLDPW